MAHAIDLVRKLPQLAFQRFDGASRQRFPQHHIDFGKIPAQVVGSLVKTAWGSPALTAPRVVRYAAVAACSLDHLRPEPCDLPGEVGFHGRVRISTRWAGAGRPLEAGARSTVVDGGPNPSAAVFVVRVNRRLRPRRWDQRSTAQAPAFPPWRRSCQ
jgi:hypothetical protein